MAVRAGTGEGKEGWEQALGAGILGFAFEAVLRGRQIADERLNVWHARLSLREAADVLRTYRRAAGRRKKAQVSANETPCSNPCSMSSSKSVPSSIFEARM